MKKWEYAWLHRVRGIKKSGLFGEYKLRDSEEWEPPDIESKIKQLGNEGWELVAVVPRSSFGGEVGAGFTSNELWVFKRPAGDIDEV